MEPPDLVSEAENCETIPPLETAPPKLSPVKELVTDIKPTQVIFPNMQNCTESMECLNLENHLPAYNVKEKIIIALDTSREDNGTYFLGKQDENISPFYALKSAVEMFVKLKLRLNKNSEFALVLLNETEPYWHHNFTNNIKEYVNVLNNIIERPTGESFNLTSLFTDIVIKVRNYNFLKDPMLPPPHVVRVLLLYSRSHVVPDIELLENLKDLFNLPYFFLDVLVTHEPVSEDNNCKKIFHFLQNLDTKGYSYFFNVNRNLDALMQSMVKLTGHPLQRPLQIDADYSL